MKAFVEIPILFKRKMLENLRQPVWVISGLIIPLLYLVLL